MIPSVGYFISLTHRIHGAILEEWKKTSGELEKKGLSDNRSAWIYRIDEEGIVIIFNQCAVPAVVFGIFNSEFFSKFSGSFSDDWEEVACLFVEDKWRPYTASPLGNGKANFERVGWRSKRSVFREKPEDEESDSAEAPAPGVLRKILD